MAEKSAIQRIKELDTERANILAQAKEEALVKANFFGISASSSPARRSARSLLSPRRGQPPPGYRGIECPGV